jgi:peptidoglycan hydrolase-like protein with peptidoglycan-binding domain
VSGVTRTRVIAAAAVAVVGTAGTLVLVLRPDDQTSAASATSTAATTTAEVERRDLVERETVTGTLGYGESPPLTIPRQGTVTAMPAEGTVIERGQSLVEVDGVPVPLLYGTVPLYRTLEAGVDDGPDVRQLEENLDALGFGSDSLTVDEHFTSATAAAVKRWQESLGLEETGRVATDALVFRPGAVRVGAHSTDVGGRAGGAVYQATGTTRVVTVRLEASRQSLAVVGDKARVQLPDGSTPDGTVLAVGTVATRENEQSPAKITVTIVLDDPNAGGSLSEAPVSVDLTKATVQGVLAVPVRALLALSEGGYAVEVERRGRSDLIAVEVGAFADGFVEVTGDLAEGDRVVMPA